MTRSCVFCLRVTVSYDAPHLRLSLRPDYDPLPHIPVVEMASDDEESEVDSLSSQFPPKSVANTGRTDVHSRVRRVNPVKQKYSSKRT